ncbi:hypothetical protein [Alteromonas sp. H39]|uniref:hypothetical protein n=1 Tax=Alteromonas sp. H39 TaxID=3389876 RepID=UPI0039DF49B6
MDISIWQLLLLAFLGFCLVPVFLTGFSTRAKGAEKAGWLILTLFTSWIGYAVFLMVTQIMRGASQRQA